MHDYEIAFRDDRSRFVLQRRRKTFHEIEKTITAGSNVRTVLDIVWRPKPFRRRIIPLVEQRIERFEHEFLVLAAFVFALWFFG